MPLSQLLVENYRCFAGSQQFALRPITVLIGRNNSGKSALARSPLILESGVRGGTADPLALDTGLARESSRSFVDLIHGKRVHGSVRFRFVVEEDSSEPVRVDVTLQNISEERAQVVSHLSLNAGTTALKAEWVPSDGAAGERRYVINDASQEDAVQVDFVGCLPNAIPDEVGDEAYRAAVAQAFEFVRASFDAPRYLGPFRQEPEPFYAFPQRAHDAVGIRGEHAPGILAIDSISPGAPILGAVNSFLPSTTTGAWELAIDRDTGLNNLFSISLDSRVDQEIRVNLADTGTGIAQALPIFVQRALDSIDAPLGATLEVIEQPELHLHPAAHADLADLYVDAVRHTRCRYIVETHSEAFLLRLRRRVAEGLHPANIGIYFVDHDGRAATVSAIELDDFGNVDGWPDGIFTEDYEESRALVREQLRRSDHADQQQR